MGRVAVILGATGLVGGSCLRQLVREPAYERVVTVARRELPRAGPTHTHRVARTDLLADEAARCGADDLYCAIGTTMAKAGSQEAFRRVDYDLPLQTAKLARANGLRQMLVVSSVGANPSSRLFYNRVKGELERDLQALGLQGLGIFRPSLLLGERDERRPGEVLATTPMKLLSPVLRGRLARYRPILAQDVARAMLRVAKRGLEGCEIFEGKALARVSSTGYST